MTSLGLARRARRRQTCGVSWLRFAVFEGLEDADPLADLLDALEEEGIDRGAHCPRVVERSPRVALCHEDAELTQSSKEEAKELFDDEGYLTALCTRHADLVHDVAVARRACSGPGCVTESGEQAARPGVGRFFMRGRLFCGPCKEQVTSLARTVSYTHLTLPTICSV